MMQHNKKFPLIALTLFLIGATVSLSTRHGYIPDYLAPVATITGTYLAFAAVVWSAVNLIILLKNNSVGQKALWVGISAVPLLLATLHTLYFL